MAFQTRRDPFSSLMRVWKPFIRKFILYETEVTVGDCTVEKKEIANGLLLVSKRIRKSLKREIQEKKRNKKEISRSRFPFFGFSFFLSTGSTRKRHKIAVSRWEGKKQSKDEKKLES